MQKITGTSEKTQVTICFACHEICFQTKKKCMQGIFSTVRSCQDPHFPISSFNQFKAETENKQANKRPNQEKKLNHKTFKKIFQWVSKFSF